MHHQKFASLELCLLWYVSFGDASKLKKQASGNTRNESARLHHRALHHPGAGLEHARGWADNYPRHPFIGRCARQENSSTTETRQANPTLCRRMLQGTTHSRAHHPHLDPSRPKRDKGAARRTFVTPSGRIQWASVLGTHITLPTHHTKAPLGTPRTDATGADTECNARGEQLRAPQAPTNGPAGPLEQNSPRPTAKLHAV